MRWLAIVGWTMGLALTACGGDASQAPGSQAPPDVATGAGCAAGAQLPNGTCCPSGKVAVNGACVAIGPRECSSDLDKATAACDIRWCWDWRSLADEACVADSPGCTAVGRACTADELAQGLGCGAGWWPRADGSCRPAGYGLAADATAPLAEIQAPAGVPPLDTIAPLGESRFCLDDAGAVVLCASAGACGAGQMPDPDNPTACIAVGPGWQCPPGFISDGKVEKGSGLMGCLADPGKCGTDPFGGVAEGPQVRFVDGNAAPGGDGSRAKPLQTINAALAAVPVGGTVAIAAGTYKEALTITKPVTVRGRCAAQVTLTTGPLQAVVKVAGEIGGETVIEGVQLSEGAYGVAVTTKRATTLRDVWIAGAAGVGVTLNGSGVKVEAERMFIDRIEGGLGGPGNGILVQYGARLDLSDVRVRNAKMAALYVLHAKSKLRGKRVLVDGVSSHPGYIGALANLAGEIDLTSARFAYNSEGGVTVQGGDSKLKLTGSIVDNTRPMGQGGGSLGCGVLVTDAAEAQLRGVRLSANTSCGLGAYKDGSKAVVNGLLVDSTSAAKGSGFAGAGIMLGLGANIAVDSARLHNNRWSGVIAVDSGTTFSGTRLLVDETQNMAPTQPSGYGVAVGAGAIVRLQRFRSHRNRHIGLAAVQAGTFLEVREALVDETLVNEYGGHGFGVSALLGATVLLQGVRVTRSRIIGAMIGDPGTRVDMNGCLFDTTLPVPQNEAQGLGIQFGIGAILRVNGSRISHNRTVGILGRGAQSSLRMTGSVVEDTGVDLLKAGDGFGVVAREMAMCEIVSSVVRRNHAINIWSFETPLAVSDSLVWGALGSTYDKQTGADGGGVVATEMGDGIVAENCDTVSVARSLVLDNLRAGLVLDGNSQSSIQDSGIAGGYFGLVTVGPLAVTEKGLALWNNSQNRASPSGLYVPGPPSAAEEDVPVYTKAE